jgi:hypothetical protein
MNPVQAAALASLLALGGCATLDSSSKIAVPVPMSAVPAGQPGKNPGPKGEVVWADLSQAMTTRKARFDDWAVAGPSVNIARRADGMWSGTMLDTPVTLSPSIGNVSGSGVDLTIEWHGTGTWVTGSCFGAPVRFEISGEHVKGTAGANVFDLKALGPGQFGDIRGLLTLSGSAARTDAAMPQMALAMLAVLIR